MWVVTTDSFPPGLYYYYLMIDGYGFSDSTSELFYRAVKNDEWNRNSCTSSRFLYPPKCSPWIIKRVLLFIGS
ncbi:MAG: hypothetical protein P8X73_14935 [Ignavibacteriaceae bacterium]